MRLFAAIIIVQLLFAGCTTSELRPAAIYGAYCYSVPGSNTVLSLKKSGEYSLAIYGFDGRTSSETCNETGKWAFDGWAVVLKVKSPVRGEPEFNPYRRLFLSETKSGSKILTSAVGAQHRSEDPRVDFVFTEGAGAPPSLPDVEKK